MKRTPLYDLQNGVGSTFAQLFDWEISDSFGDPAAEHYAAREGVALLDRSYAGRFRVMGRDALDLLNRLSSNKLEELPAGTGIGTILPTNKGRVIDLLHIFAREDHLLLLMSPQTRERVAEWIDLYTFLEEVTLEDVTESTAMLTVLGPQAPQLIEAALGVSVAGLEPYASIAVPVGDAEAILLRTDPLNTPGYDLLVPDQQASVLWKALASSSLGVVLIGEGTFNLLRIEAGIPRYGWEISEAVNPWEANLQEYINFEKGCYIGQEVILRLNTYKKVQKLLMALTFPKDAEVVLGDNLYGGNDEAGLVTSVAQQPTTGKMIGLGLIKRAFAVPGMQLRLDKTDNLATVKDLPARVPLKG